MGMGMQVAANETKTQAHRMGDPDAAAAAPSPLASTSSSSMVRWERFLPKMVMRVLLVEADDSTRQIIAALLRKCSYRVVAVSDGLKAWELLKGRPHNIDLILTEVDLPSISGFALLTLTMEHEICKNIPVIMMSSQDSVTTVYKCMMRGAADFLVKPLRKNELTNLWQHVWRRQASRVAGVGPPDDTVAQQECEATAENNATSNRLDGYMARTQRNQECIDKGTDAQSSCTKPEMDTEAENIECEQDLSSDMKTQQKAVGFKANDDLQMHDADPARSRAAAVVDCEPTIQREEMNVDDHRKHEKFTFKTLDSNGILANPSQEAIDLIGAFDNYLKCNYSNSAPNVGANKTDSPPLLDLSLRRSNPSGSVNQGTDDSYRLNHSDSSAFSQYINKALQSPQSTSPSTCDQQKGNMNSSARQLSNLTFDYNSDTRDPGVSSQRHALLSAGQPEQAEIAFASPQKRALPAPIAVRGVRLENLRGAFSPAMSPMLCMQSGLPLMQSPGSAGHQQATFVVNTFQALELHNSNIGQYNNQMDRATIDATDQSDNKLEMLEDRGHFSSTAQSANSSFCNGTVSQLHNLSYGSNSNADISSVINTASECGKEDTFPTHDRHSHRSMQREAALTKFRLKRKERCFEKKVRYESRKKLAEQRPRVKGQFVGQGHNEPPGSS